VLAIAVGVALSGARGFHAVAEWAEDMTRDTLRRLGWKRPRSPSEPTIRRLWTSTQLNGYLDFPDVGQVFVIQGETTNLVTGQPSLETAYGRTSLSPVKANPPRLLALQRCHGVIENRLHGIRDFVFDEDRCRIRRSAGARVMASLLHLAFGLARLAGATRIAEWLRFCARDLLRPLRLIGLGMA